MLIVKITNKTHDTEEIDINYVLAKVPNSFAFDLHGSHHPTEHAERHVQSPTLYRP
jgi:hypothetical protein